MGHYKHHINCSNRESNVGDDGGFNTLATNYSHAFFNIIFQQNPLNQTFKLNNFKGNIRLEVNKLYIIMIVNWIKKLPIFYGIFYALASYYQKALKKV